MVTSKFVHVRRSIYLIDAAANRDRSIENFTSKIESFTSKMSVQYWEDQYVQKYMANSDGDVYLSQVDSSVLYDGLDSLRIKVAGETTGLHSVEWLRDLEPPDIRYPFKDMVIIT